MACLCITKQSILLVIIYTGTLSLLRVVINTWLQATKEVKVGEVIEVIPKEDTTYLIFISFSFNTIKFIMLL